MTGNSDFCPVVVLNREKLVFMSPYDMSLYLMHGEAPGLVMHRVPVGTKVKILCQLGKRECYAARVQLPDGSYGFTRFTSGDKPSKVG